MGTGHAIDPFEVCSLEALSSSAVPTYWFRKVFISPSGSPGPTESPPRPQALATRAAALRSCLSGSCLPRTVLVARDPPQLCWPAVWVGGSDSPAPPPPPPQAMTLMEYLIKTGSERVSQQCKENMYAVQTLKDFQYVDRDGKDQGVNVREKAKQLVALLRDEDRLREERAHALKTKEKLAQTATGEALGPRVPSAASPPSSPGRRLLRLTRRCSRVSPKAQGALPWAWAWAWSGWVGGRGPVCEPSGSRREQMPPEGTQQALWLGREKAPGGSWGFTGALVGGGVAGGCGACCEVSRSCWGWVSSGGGGDQHLEQGH